MDDRVRIAVSTEAEPLKAVLADFRESFERETLSTFADGVAIFKSAGFLRENTAASSMSGFWRIALSTPLPKFPYPIMPIFMLIFF